MALSAFNCNYLIPLHFKGLSEQFVLVFQLTSKIFQLQLQLQ